MVLVVDDLLIGGFQWVMRRLAEAVDSEMNDDTVYREELLAAQMRLELGEITEAEFAEAETELLAKIREVKERHGIAGPTPISDGYAVSGIEVTSGLEEAEGTGPAAEEPSAPVVRRRRR
jgi:hypothetical protein